MSLKYPRKVRFESATDTLVTGAPGSGKTQCVVLPVFEASHGPTALFTAAGDSAAALRGLTSAHVGVPIHFHHLDPLAETLDLSAVIPEKHVFTLGIADVGETLSHDSSAAHTFAIGALARVALAFRKWAKLEANAARRPLLVLDGYWAASEPMIELVNELLPSDVANVIFSVQSQSLIEAHAGTAALVAVKRRCITSVELHGPGSFTGSVYAAGVLMAEKILFAPFYELYP